MLVADKFLVDIMTRIQEFEDKTGVEVQLIRIKREKMKELGHCRDKTIAIGISMEAS